MVKIAITGADGLVASRIIELLQEKFFFLPLSRKEMDITDRKKVEKVIADLDFDFFIHAAAYTNVAEAEINKKLCYQINVEGTKNVFDAVIKKGKKFIYVSTDFVFDGKNPPYFEDSKPTPAGIYGQSKYEGEKIVANKGMIIRISYPYRSQFENKKDFLRKFKQLLEENKPLKMITDSLITPTFIDDIAFALEFLINNFSYEIFHLVGAKAISPYQAAIMIAEKFNLNKSLIEKTSYQEYVKTKPGLPQYSDIRSKKNNFYKMKTFEEGLKVIKSQILNSKYQTNYKS